MRKIKLLFAAALSLIAWTGVMAQSGTGAQNDPFVVKTADDLNNLRKVLVSGSMNYVVLENDVDMAAIEDWYPIFDNVNPYYQIDFDGKGHVISNLTSKTDGQYDYCGLFGVLCGNVRNLGVKNADVTCTGGTGIIAGYLGHSQYGQTCYVENVWVTGKLSASGYCGGMFGNIANESHITNCYANVEVIGEGDLTGGIIGRIRAAVVMTNVYAAGSINKGGGIIGGGFQDATPAGSYKNVAVWNNTTSNFGPVRDSDAQTGILYYDGTNFADLQSQVVAWDPSVWSCDMAADSYPVLSYTLDASDSPYEAALAAIEDGAQYRIFTDVDGTKYYVTAEGTLTAEKAKGDAFTFKKITEGGDYVVDEAGTKAVGIQLTSSTGTRFTNGPLNNNQAVLEVANFSTSTNNRAGWESQVFFLKDGKYAIRTCNVAYGESSWADAGRTFWTYTVEPVDPEYTYDAAYVWELEEYTETAEQKEALATVQNWPVYIQSAAGLVKDYNKYYSNAKQTTEGSYEALLDGNYETFFHSCWSNGPDEDHYLQAEFAEATQKFNVYYKKRQQNNNNRPTTIVISAGNDAEGEFTNIATINSGLPTDAAVTDFFSGLIDLGAAYKYVRFTVLETNNNAENNGHKFFTFSEFYMFPEAAAQLAPLYNAYASALAGDLTADDLAQITTADKTLKSTISTITVTYVLTDGAGSIIETKEVVQKPYSEIEIPVAWMSNTKFFDYTPQGTIGDTDCTIMIVQALKAGFVGSLNQLSNNKAYNIICDRGAMLTNGTTIASTSNEEYATAEPGQFAIISYEGKYYIYSVADGLFVANNGSLVEKPGNGIFDAIVMDPKTTPYFMFSFKVDEGTSYGVNTNGTGALGGIVINDWMNADPGNQYYMVEAADFDPTEALKALDAQFHPAVSVIYVVNDEFGNTIFTSDPEPVDEGATISELPEKYQRTFYRYRPQPVQVTEANTPVPVTAIWDGPFKISADFENANWYDMAMRGTWYVTSDVKDGDGAYKTQNANTMGLVEDSYHWAFIGDGYNGFKIINKAAGEGFSFGWTDATATNAGIPTIMADGEGYHAWKIVASTNTSVPANSFCLNVPGTNLYINQYGGAGGSVKFWNSANNVGDPGSAFTVFDIPTDFSSFVVDEIAPAMDATGYFAFTDEAKAAIGYDESKKTECSFEDYKTIKENMAAAMEDISNFVLPETGVYILTNKYYPNKGIMGMDPTDANMYGDYAKIKDTRNYVTLTKVGDGIYTISMMGKYAPATVAQSTPVVASTEAGNYTVVITTPGYAAFQADTEVNMSCLHRRSEGDLVGWEPTADASMWAATKATSIELTVGETGYATAYLPFAVEVGKTISVPAAIGTWTFDDPSDLMAGTGSAKMYANDGVAAVDGGAIKVAKGHYLKMQTGLGNGVGTYSFMMDVMLPADKGTESSLSAYSALFQNKPANDGDGSFFIYWNKKDGTRKVGVNSGGLGYGGSIECGTWYRVIFSCENSIPTVYVDGVKVAAATSAVAEHWTLQDALLFFADNDGEDNEILTSEIRFWDVALTDAEAGMLGAVGTEVPEPSTVVAYTGRVYGDVLGLAQLDGTIPAKTAVILKGDPATYAFNITEDVDPIENNDLKGTLEPIDAAGKYVLAKPAEKEVGFYLAEGGKIAAGKAYIESEAGVKAFFFGGEAETGISDLKDVKEVNGAIYNLSGQRVSKAQKGIYIINGKKVLK